MTEFLCICGYFMRAGDNPCQSPHPQCRLLDSGSGKSASPILTAIDEIASWEGPATRWLRSVNLSAGVISGEDESRLSSERYLSAGGDHAPGSGASGCSSNISEESDRD